MCVCVCVCVCVALQSTVGCIAEHCALGRKVRQFLDLITFLCGSCGTGRCMIMYKMHNEVNCMMLFVRDCK